MRANYAGNVTLIDEQIGIIIGVLRERGELESTLIVFTSDHGEMNGDQGLIYKANFLDPAISVPLIVRPPHTDSSKEGGTIQTIAEWMDVGATIADYAGASLSDSAQSKSLRPLLEGSATQHREFAVSEFMQQTALIDGDWKIEFGPDDRADLLLNRVDDPLEQFNLADDPGRAPTIERLRQRLHDFRRRSTAPPVKATLD